MAPLAPKFAISSSRIIFIEVLLSTGDEGHEANVAGSLDSPGQPFLVVETGAAETAGDDLAVLVDIVTKEVGLHEVDVKHLVFAEPTELLLSEVKALAL